MKIFRKILKNKLFYLVLLLGVFLTPIFNFTLQAQETYEDGFNLVNPDLENKEHLGNGVYRLHTQSGGYLDYNVYNGHYRIHGAFTGLLLYSFGTRPTGDHYAQIWEVENVSYGGASIVFLGGNSFSQVAIGGTTNITYDGKKPVYHEHYYISLYKPDWTGDTDIDVTFKLQFEKGDTTTPYKLPIQPLYDHAYNAGHGDGYNTGYVDGEYDGYQYGYEVGEIDGYSQAEDYYGYYDEETGEWITAEDYWQEGYDSGYQDGYDFGYDDGELEGYIQGQNDYGYYDVDAGEWITAEERWQEFYDRGYQDGVDDTNAYYNDNGLFIPQLTPKAHLVAEGDQRYDDPYFYLRDFSGQYDDEYFGFESNRWLEKAFNWAYSVESDFLAFNDVYIIKYKNDEVLYKYFFYKYDTDSVYFYGESGALLKVVERADFDYFIYEAPELSLEEQNRVDDAYNKGYNNAKVKYGIYDSQSDEYLTATEYGEIQYNLGVISIRDKAYLDGFHTGMMDSHKYGFDWVRGTYYELIDQRPILGNLRDETSFTYQSAHTQGFNEARGRYGFWNGRVWVTAEFVREDSYTDGYNSGFRDGTNELYNDVYDEIYNIGYRDGQRIGANNKFYTGLEKWLVPAIIVVLFFGLLMLFPRSKED